jgi:hypothetical protein
VVRRKPGFSELFESENDRKRCGKQAWFPSVFQVDDKSLMKLHKYHEPMYSSKA